MTDWTGQVGKGWGQMVDVVLAVVRRHGGVIAQVKEKFGGLRIYFDLPDDLDPEIAREIHSLAAGAERLSNYTCEECGAPGRHCTPRGGWILTLCERCEDVKRRE